MRYILSCIRRAVEDFDMIQDGDKVAVGVSGGKDSMVLLKAMHLYRYFSKAKFELHAITIDMGLTDDMDTEVVRQLCEEWDIKYHVEKTNIGKIVFEGRKEKNPCSLCSKMRRGSIHDVCKEHGINKIALGHHRDDVVETFLMGLLYEGRLNTFAPFTYMDRADITQIRPMIYAPEKEVEAALRRNKLPVIKSVCPADGNTKRQDMKELIKILDKYTEGEDASKYIMLAIKKTGTYRMWDKIKRKPES